MTPVICQTFMSLSRTEIQRMAYEKEPWPVSRVSHIMSERKPNKLSLFFSISFSSCTGTLLLCGLSFLIRAVKEWGVHGLLILETHCKAAAVYAGKLMIFSFKVGAALHGLNIFSCIGQNLTFIWRELCILLKTGLYEFRWVECLLTWFVIIY